MSVRLTEPQLNRELIILRDAIRDSRALMTSVKIVEETKVRKRLALVTLNDLVDKMQSVLTLAQNNRASGIEILVRSGFESYVDLINIYGHPNQYAKYMFYLSAEHTRKGLQAIINTPNSPYSQAISRGAPKHIGLTVRQMLDMSKREIQDHERDLTAQYRLNQPKKAVRNRDINRTVQLRAKLAGKSNEYDAMYRMFSKTVHGEIGSMLSTVISGDYFIWPPTSRAPGGLAITLAIQMTVDTAKLVAKNCRKPVTPFRKLEDRFDRWSKSIYNAPIR